MRIRFIGNFSRVKVILYGAVKQIYTQEGTYLSEYFTNC